MKCPSCGNYARSGFSTYFGLSFFPFSCQYCNERLRANIFMIFVDLLMLSAVVGYIAFLFAYAKPIADLFGEWSFPFLGFAGILAVRTFFYWLLSKTGRFHHAY